MDGNVADMSHFAINVHDMTARTSDMSHIFLIKDVSFPQDLKLKLASSVYVCSLSTAQKISHSHISVAEVDEKKKLISEYI